MVFVKVGYQAGQSEAIVGRGFCMFFSRQSILNTLFLWYTGARPTNSGSSKPHDAEGGRRSGQELHSKVCSSKCRNEAVKPLTTLILCKNVVVRAILCIGLLKGRRGLPPCRRYKLY